LSGNVLWEFINGEPIGRLKAEHAIDTVSDARGDSVL
jgi:hypothetical protein